MKRLFFAGISAAFVLFLNFQIAQGAIGDTTFLRSKPIYGKEAKVMTYSLDNNHYRKINLDDSLSSVILDSFVKSLDNNKQYFTSADLQKFDSIATRWMI